MDEKALVKKICMCLGGRSNIEEITLCANRLRFRLKNIEKIQEDQLKNTEGILEFINRKGEYQILFSNNTESIYRELERNLSLTSSSKIGIGKMRRLCSKIGSAFLSVLPILIGACILEIVLAILVYLDWITERGIIYTILSDTIQIVFIFFPFLLSLSLGRIFRCNRFLCVMTAAIFMMSNGADGLSTTQIPILDTVVPIVNYNAMLIPLIFTIWLVGHMDDWMKKIVENSWFDLLRKIIVLFITVPIVLYLIVPIYTQMISILVAGILGVQVVANWFVPMIIGGLFPVIMVLGLQYGLTPKATVLASAGMDFLIGPGMFAGFLAQAGAAFVVAMKTKYRKTRQLAGYSSFLCLFGFCEPAVYGIDLKRRVPLYASMAGGAIAGLYMGIFQVQKVERGLPGILLLPSYYAGGIMNLVHVIIGSVLGCAISSFLTYRFLDDDIELRERTIIVENKVINSLKFPKDISEFEQAQGEIIAACTSGRAIPLQHVNDPIFANELLGKGVAILPTEGRIVAPVRGKVIVLFDSKHAIGIESENDTEVLIHIGLGTVSLKGEYFHACVDIGDWVEVGDTLIEFDLEKIKDLGYDTVIPVTICNSDDYKQVISLIHQEVKVLEPLTKVVR